MNSVEELKNFIKVQKDINEQLPVLYGVGKEEICFDGIYDPEAFFQREQNRVLVILKEVNCTKGVWSPVDQPDNHYCMEYHPKNRPASVLTKNLAPFLSNGELQPQQIRGIGYINVSKKVHDETRTKENELKANFELTKEILYRQIKAINPNFILFGGTFGLFWCSLKDNLEGLFYRLKFKDDLLNNFKEKDLSLWKKEKGDRLTLIQIRHPSGNSSFYNHLARGMEECNKNEYELIYY